MTAVLSKEDRVFLAVWRRVGRGETIPPLTFPSAGDATSVRFKFFRVIHPYRSSEGLDVELEAAAQRYSLSQKGNQLFFSEKATIRAADQLLTELALTDDELQTSEELAMLNRLKALSNLNNEGK